MCSSDLCDSGTFTHQFAVVSDSELATAVCGEDLKKAVVGAERDAANREFAAAVGPANIMLMLGNAIRRTLVSLLDNTPSAKALPASMLLQLEAVRSALDELLVKRAAEEFEPRGEEIREILVNNKKLLNVALNTLEADWLSTVGVTAADAAALAEKASKKKSDEKSAVSEDTDMSGTPMASAFGFERLSGEKPELKIAEEQDEQPEVHGVFKPKPDGTYIVSENTEQLFKILQVSRKYSPQNVDRKSIV